MNQAFDNYLALSDVLRSDLAASLDCGSDDPIWRRNFIRAAGALVEGLGHCFREITAIGLDCIAPELAKKEKEVLLSELNFSTGDRAKFTLRAAHQMFELEPVPDFGAVGWTNATTFLRKRHSLMHPKSISDTDVSDTTWEECRLGILWLSEQLFSVIRLLHEKHAKAGSYKAARPRRGAKSARALAEPLYVTKDINESYNLQGKRISVLLFRTRRTKTTHPCLLS